jgi:LPXTG-motif cell wall-anchored protein
VCGKKQTPVRPETTLLYRIRSPSGIPAVARRRRVRTAHTRQAHEGKNMDTNTLLIVVLVLLLVGGGGFFYRRRI